MTVPHNRPDNHRKDHRYPAVLAVLAFLIGGGMLAGCGSSTKPAYCDPVSKTEDAVKSLPTVQDVKNNGVGTLKTAVSTLQKNATNAINQAQSDFSSQTAAMRNSLDALSSTVKQLASSPSAATLAQLPAQLLALSTAAKNLQSAVSSKCG